MNRLKEFGFEVIKEVRYEDGGLKYLEYKGRDNGKIIFDKELGKEGKVLFRDVVVDSKKKKRKFIKLL